MPQVIDRVNEDALSVLFSDNFMNSLKQHLGYDPTTPCADLPFDLEGLLEEVISIVEQQQWRFIRRKPVTMLLPFEAFQEPDCMLFLPYGSVASLTSFTYKDTDGANIAVQSSEYTLYQSEPIKLWCRDWYSVFTDIDSEMPYPITITYTPGYQYYQQIPRSTIRAIRVLAYHIHEYRDAIAEGNASMLPQGYEHHRDLNFLNCQRAIKYTAEDFRKIGSR
jgi:hypothetical protein